MSDRSRRQDTRYPVQLAVRYGVASEFIKRHAENLSMGGLFIRGAQELVPEQKVIVEVDLPGYGSFKVSAVVAHVVTPEQAARAGRTPGAGLRMTELPRRFDDAIGGYLRRLELRAKRVVLVAKKPIAMVLAGAGYQTQLAPAPSEVVAAIAHAPDPVIGVIVSSADVAAYAEAAKKAGAGDIVVAMDRVEDAGRVLGLLDEELV